MPSIGQPPVLPHNNRGSSLSAKIAIKNIEKTISSDLRGLSIE
jgi:hypothetical protein